MKASVKLLGERKREKKGREKERKRKGKEGREEGGKIKHST